jgi:hypothetical protein
MAPATSQQFSFGFPFSLKTAKSSQRELREL